MSSKSNVINISEQNIRKIRVEIEEDISYNKKLITRHEETIQRLRTGKHPFPVGQKIDNTKKEIVIIKEKIDTLNKKLNDLILGNLNEDIQKEISNNMKTIQSKSESTKKKKQEQNNMMKTSVKNPVKTTNSKPSSSTPTSTITTSSLKQHKNTSPSHKKNYSQNSYNHYNPNNNVERQMCYDYDKYASICNSIPDYMIEKLNNMENNMGYIWKDIWCFGTKPIRNQRNVDNITLFEKKNGIHYVHFYDKTNYKLFEKDSNGNKKLISSRPRK